jgi:uncharacterized protein
MPGGKRAGVPCVQLSPQGLCGIYGRPERPAVCASLKATAQMCGSSREEALAYLAALEAATEPPIGGGSNPSSSDSILRRSSS